MELAFLVLANSLKRHLKGGRKIVVHAFHADPIVQDPAYFTALNSASFELRLRPIEKQTHGLATWPGHLTPSTLFRLQVPSLLNNIDRVVYLDCDLIVLNDITTLYDTDLLGFPLAACLDFWLTGGPPFSPPIVGWGVEEWHQFLRKVVGLSDHKTYFNAGVLVMDLSKFRNTGLVQAAEEFLERANDKTMYVDQDALNHVIDGAFVRLDSRWNVLGVRAANDLSNATEPWVIHYAGPYKPWSCEARRKAIWNRRFWQEAAQSAVLPFLVQTYLETCDRRGLSKLQSAAVLLSSGKPHLTKHDILAHAEKFGAFAAAAEASRSIARDLDRTTERTDIDAALVSVEGLTHHCGVRDGDTLIFDLAAADGHLISGPYRWYPAGHYEAAFDLAVMHVAPGATGKLMIDIVDDADRYLAQRELFPASPPAETTLQFVVDEDETFLAFRVFATGFATGELRFGGVTLRPRPPQATR